MTDVQLTTIGAPETAAAAPTGTPRGRGVGKELKPIATGRSLLATAWMRIERSKIAPISLGVVVAMILLAVLAPVLTARPDPSSEPRERIRLAGDLPSRTNPPSGCVFRTRCRAFALLGAEARKRCETDVPSADVACHFPRAPLAAAAA